jgi:hypothetical protein
MEESNIRWYSVASMDTTGPTRRLLTLTYEMKRSYLRRLYRVRCFSDRNSSAGKDFRESDFGLFSKLYRNI